MSGLLLSQVSNQTGSPEAVAYGCKKYRVSMDTRVDKLVDTVVKDHRLPDDSDYMKDKMMCVKVGIGDAQDETFLLWEGETTKGMSLKEFAFSENTSIPNRVAIMHSAWQREVADDDMREIIEEVKEEDLETEWGLKGMSRQAWVYAKGQQMLQDGFWKPGWAAKLAAQVTESVPVGGGEMGSVTGVVVPPVIPSATFATPPRRCSSVLCILVPVCQILQVAHHL